MFAVDDWNRRVMAEMMSIDDRCYCAAEKRSPLEEDLSGIVVDEGWRVVGCGYRRKVEGSRDL